MIHLDRIKQIQQKQKELKHFQNISVEKASKQFIDDLLTMKDPFMKDKYRVFLK
jgi:hypothetical protein